MARLWMMAAESRDGVLSPAKPQEHPIENGFLLVVLGGVFVGVIFTVGEAAAVAGGPLPPTVPYIAAEPVHGLGGAVAREDDVKQCARHGSRDEAPGGEPASAPAPCSARTSADRRGERAELGRPRRSRLPRTGLLSRPGMPRGVPPPPSRRRPRCEAHGGNGRRPLGGCRT